MKVYCHPRWSTCKKTIRLIEEQNKTYEYIDLTKESIDYELLLSLYQTNDIPLKKYFNTSGVEYRTNGIKLLFDQNSDEEMLELISKNGLLLKRPFIIDNDVLYIGKSYEEKFSN